MKLKYIHLIIFVGTILGFYACSDSIDFPDPDAKGNVAIIYWIGDNNLSTYADYDIDELTKGKDNIPANDKVVIYVDEPNANPVIYQLDAQNGLQVWKKFAKEQDCTDSLTVLNNLREIIKNFPAKKYGLTFGAHGSGWVIHRRAMGYDQSHSNKWLNIPTLRGILERLPHMSYIFFDVCFMQDIQVAYELRKQTDWIVGSPAEIPAPGAPYHLILKALCECDPSGIINGYNNYYPIGNYTGTLLSAVNCSQLENLAACTSKYIRSYFANRHTIGDDITQDIQRYSTTFSDNYTYYYDMSSAMHKILSEEEYNEWFGAFEMAVPIRKYNTGEWYSPSICNYPYLYDNEHFGGISMYIPQTGTGGTKKNNELRAYQWYKAAGWDKTGW